MTKFPFSTLLETAKEKRIFWFYLLSSFATAVLGFLLINTLKFDGAFGFGIHMPSYHYEHFMQYIIIPCFFFSMLAVRLAKKFLLANMLKRIFYILFMAIATIFLSSPFGGFLFHFHDMMAGYFPEDYLSKLLIYAPLMGLQYGWAIILGAFPYTPLGIIVSYFIMLKGARRYLAV
jgi:hypothetical protein